MFDQAKAEQIVEQIWQGQSLRQAAAIAGVKHNTFLDWADASKPLGDQYARAIAERGTVHAERIEAVVDQVATGELAPDQARVMVDALKWTASKLNPKKYGDRIAVDADLRVQITVNDPFAPLPATAQLLPHAAGASVAQEIPSAAADGQATPVPPRSGAELCRVPVSENSGQPFPQSSPAAAVSASESTPSRLERATIAAQPSPQVRISPRTGKPVRPYTRRKP